MPVNITLVTVVSEVYVTCALIAIAYYAVRIHKEGKYTAAHELGHALVAIYYHVPVHRIVINQFGTGGYTTFDIPKNTKNYAAIIVAGYVAEETAKGNPIGYALRLGVYDGDANILRTIIGEDPEQVKIAIQSAAEILNKPEVQKVLNESVPKLISKGELSGLEVHL